MRRSVSSTPALFAPHQRGHRKPTGSGPTGNALNTYERGNS